MNPLLHIAIDAAVKAGKAILEIYESSDFGIELKEDHSPLTKADKTAHEIIAQYLETTNFPILSEEGLTIHYQDRKAWKTFWMVDPLDGTKEFIKRNGEFTVNIALIENGMPIAGVVYVPIRKELYYADHQGSFKTAISDENNIRLNDAQKLPLKLNRDEYVVLASKSHINKETEAYINNIHLQGRKLKIESRGSSLKFCLIAEGLADCYPRMGPTMEWDTAAGHAIAKYANKEVNIYPDGTPLIYNKENLLNPYFIVSSD